MSITVSLKFPVIHMRWQHNLPSVQYVLQSHPLCWTQEAFLLEWQSGAQDWTSLASGQFSVFSLGRSRTALERTESHCPQVSGNSVCAQPELPGCPELAKVQFLFFFPFQIWKLFILHWNSLDSLRLESKAQQPLANALCSLYLTELLNSVGVFFPFSKTFSGAKMSYKKNHFQLGRTCFWMVSYISPHGVHMMRQLQFLPQF